MELKAEQVLSALASVQERQSAKDLVRLGAVRDLRVGDGTISFRLVLPESAASQFKAVREQCVLALRNVFGNDVSVDIVEDNELIGLGDDFQIIGDPGADAQPDGIRNTIAVASGKGGVGKSTVAANLAVALAQQGYDVGLLDADIYGPSIPTMFGAASERPRVNDQRKLLPITKHGVHLVSMGFLVDANEAVIWRGPMVSNAVRQFLGDVSWGELDYLILDLPPGTGDIQLTIVQTVPLTGAVIVSTPQQVALADARKGVAMFGQVNVPVLGIVENMAFFSPPDLPDRKYYLFGDGGAKALASELGLPVVGEIPIEQSLREACDEGAPAVISQPHGACTTAFFGLATEVTRQVNLLNAGVEPSIPVEIEYR